MLAESAETKRQPVRQGNRHEWDLKAEPLPFEQLNVRKTLSSEVTPLKINARAPALERKPGM